MSKICACIAIQKVLTRKHNESGHKASQLLYLFIYSICNGPGGRPKGNTLGLESCILTLYCSSCWKGSSPEALRAALVSYALFIYYDHATILKRNVSDEYAI